MSIEAVLLEAIRQLGEEKFDAAMTSACIALDATAKNEFGGRSEQRCRQFVAEYLDVLTVVGFGGAIHAQPGSKLNVMQPESPLDCVSMEDLIYRSIRCNLIHEAALPMQVAFTKEAFYGERNGTFHIPVLLIFAVVLSVISAPSNASRSLGTDVVMTVAGRDLHLENLWGRPQALRQQLHIQPPQATSP